MMPTSPAGYASMEAKRRRDREEAERNRRADNSAPAYSAPVVDYTPSYEPCSPSSSDSSACSYD